MGLMENVVTRSIVDPKKEESDALLAFLFNHIGRGIDWQARVKWAPVTVVVWDVGSSSLISPLITFPSF
jgi:alpha-ketoglutarate-dependent taurine dioxygenase